MATEVIKTEIHTDGEVHYQIKSEVEYEEGDIQGSSVFLGGAGKVGSAALNRQSSSCQLKSATQPHSCMVAKTLKLEPVLQTNFVQVASS